MEVNELVKKEARRQGMSPRTIEAYQFCLSKFFRRYKKDARSITKSDIKDYLDTLAEHRSSSTINLHMSAIKFLMKDVLQRNINIDLKYARRAKAIPVFLTREETALLISNISNPKHRLMVELIYSAGLRVSELLNLKVRDFQFEYDYGWVRHGKGNKDRMFIIASRLKGEVQNYISSNCLNPDDYLFKGNNSNKLSIRTVQEIVKKAAKASGIRKNVHPHTLRHSFATHLAESDISLEDLKNLLGHSSTKTTMVYIHAANRSVTQTKSPFDAIEA